MTEEEKLRLENIKRGQKYAEEAEAIAADVEKERVTEEQAELAARIKDVGPELAAATTEDPERPEGLFSKAGGFVEDIVSGDLVLDSLNSVARKINPDMPTRQQLELQNQARVEQVRDSGNILERATAGVTTNLEAVAEGMKGGLLTPLALPAVLAGEDTGWNEAPATVKGSPISKSIYDIAKVATPGLILGGAMGVPMSAGKALLLESGVETVANRDPDDYLLSRTAAKAMGQLANTMGMDGYSVTEGLLKGEGIGYRTVGMLAGFMHNLGINIAADKLVGGIVRKFGGPKTVDPTIEQVAKDSGKSVDEVAETLSVKAEPVFSASAEPLDGIKANAAVNAVVGDAPKGVSPLGFLQRIVGEQNDDLVRKPFFLSVNGFTGGDKGLIQTVNILTDHMDRFPVAAKTKARMAIEAMEFISENAELFKKPTAQLIQDYVSKYTKGVDLSKLTTGQVNSLNYDMVKNATIAPQGTLIAGLAMRDVNQQAITLSRQIMTADSSGVDWSGALPALKDMVEAMETWGSIYRQDQQLWHIDGEFKQDAFQNGMLTGKGLSKFFKTATKWANKDKSIYGKPEELFNVASPHLAENQHFTKLIQAAIDGDKKAKSVVRDIVGIMSVENASNPMDISVMTSERMLQAFYDGTGEMIPRIWMSLNLLGRFRSAFRALGATALRNMTQEFSATIGMAGIKLQTDPKAMLKAQSYNDHIALFTGQAMMLGDSLRVSKQALIQNKPIMEAKTRWKGQMTSLNEQLSEVNQKYFMTINELTRRGELTPQRKMAMTASLLMRKIGMNPYLNTVPRALMAQDEGFKVAAGASYANMMAGRMRLDPKYNGKTDAELFELATREVFQDGDPLKGFAITAGEARDYADFLTMQREITPDMGDFVSSKGLRISGVMNAAFRALESATEESAIFSWANPFVRMSWEITSQASTQLTGAIPGGPTIANWLDPDFRQTLRGDHGLVAKLELESNLAAGMANAWIMAGAALSGWVIVTNFDPKRGEQGSAMKIQTPGMREPLEIGLQTQDPGILTLGMVAVLANEFRDGSISRGDYETGIFNIFKNYGVGLLDQNVLIGMTNITELLDHRNFNEGIASTLGKTVGGLTSLGPLRMLSDWAGGEVIPTEIEDQPIGNFGRNWMRATGMDIAWKNRRMPMTNPWTGESQTTRAMPEDPNFWDKITSGMIAEVVPFRVTRSTIEGPLAKEAYKYGWELSGNVFKKAEGAMPFENITQVAQFSKDFTNPEAGDFRGKMKALFQSKRYKDAVKFYEKTRAKNERDNKVLGFLPAPQTATEENALADINAMKDQVVKDAQTDALMKGELAPWYKQNKIEAEQQKNPFYQEQALNGRTEGMYAQAAQQDTQLASQVRDLLNIPV